ncbi:hypothetical protein MKZ38_001463 [Zalerion maritima]|uniref:Uncharacterized protein n=1 Tax=Zalerion maritima TaxID=339359 RepID=A0AAD5S5F5_9PEZI|nr:hypothetical protein MKZ38_001463 [Zalerion maritima]
MGYLTINNNVSLVSFQIAPSTFILASIAALITFAAFAYIHVLRTRLAQKTFSGINSLVTGVADGVSTALVPTDRSLRVRERDRDKERAHQAYDRNYNYDPETSSDPDYSRDRRRRRQLLEIAPPPPPKNESTRERQKEREKEKRRSRKKDQLLLENGHRDGRGGRSRGEDVPVQQSPKPRKGYISRLFGLNKPAGDKQTGFGGYLSPHHSVFNTDPEDGLTDSEADSSSENGDFRKDSLSSAGGYSPPAWRRLGNGDRSSGFWRNNDNILGTLQPSAVNKRRSLGGYPQPPYGGGGIGAHGLDTMDEECDDNDSILQKAARTRLPGSMSPEKGRSPEPEFRTSIARVMGADVNYNRLSPVVKRDPIETPVPAELANDNYIRFQVRAEVQHRTEPIESAITFVKIKFRAVTKSWTSLFFSAMVALLSISFTRSLFQPAIPRPVPDLVKVAGIARSFEPLIYFSENGVSQVNELQATGVAVWDLGESVRTSNMTSAPIIVKELDGLSESLNTLAVELTKFFANVDGDIDAILIVMDWARRELSNLQAQPAAGLSSAFDNIHNILSSAGVLEDGTGNPTRLGQLTTVIFGLSHPQQTRQTLTRTFHEFLSVLEEAVSNELQHSLALFALFESIDRQFLNLGRTVVRESSYQESRHSDLLSSLWTRILGAKASEVHKYERNKLLLQNVRERTVSNKGILVEHHHRLQTLKANLESLRRKLVSPLVRSENSSTLTIEEQIRGLEGVGEYLEGVRQRQKGKLMEILYGGGGGRERRMAIEDY